MAVELHCQSPSELVGAGACLSTERSVSRLGRAMASSTAADQAVVMTLQGGEHLLLLFL